MKTYVLYNEKTKKYLASGLREVNNVQQALGFDIGKKHTKDFCEILWLVSGIKYSVLKKSIVK